jgi:hypothetical protein
MTGASYDSFWAAHTNNIHTGLNSEQNDFACLMEPGRDLPYFVEYSPPPQSLSIPALRVPNRDFSSSPDPPSVSEILESCTRRTPFLTVSAAKVNYNTASFIPPAAPQKNLKSKSLDTDKIFEKSAAIPSTPTPKARGSQEKPGDKTFTGEDLLQLTRLSVTHKPFFVKHGGKKKVWTQILNELVQTRPGSKLEKLSYGVIQHKVEGLVAYKKVCVSYYIFARIPCSFGCLTGFIESEQCRQGS